MNNRYNYKYEFKQISIKEIQSTYIIGYNKLSITDICLIASITDRSITIIIYLTASIINRSIITAFYYTKSVSHLTHTTMIGQYK